MLFLFNIFNLYFSLSPPPSLSLSLSQAFLRSFSEEMEANIENPSQPNRCYLDGVHKTSIIEWNKKRKLQIDQLDLLRPKHKCWVRRFSSEHGSMFDDNLELATMHKLMVKSKTSAPAIDDISEPESAKDSNSFIEDSDTAMSVNEEAKLHMACAKTYLCGRPSNSFDNWDDCNVRTSSREEDRVVERESSYDNNDDIQALMNLEEHSLASGICTDNVCSEYAKDDNEHSLGKEFEDIFYTSGVNPNIYVLSSGKWNIVDQEAHSNSSTRSPRIDQEFEQYFSMFML